MILDKTDPHKIRTLGQSGHLKEIASLYLHGEYTYALYPKRPQCVGQEDRSSRKNMESIPLATTYSSQ